MDTPTPSPQGPATLPPPGAEALLAPLDAALGRFLDATQPWCPQPEEVALPLWIHSTATCGFKVSRWHTQTYTASIPRLKGTKTHHATLARTAMVAHWQDVVEILLACVPYWRDATISIGAYATHQHAFWIWSVGSAHGRCDSRDQVAQDIPAIARLLLGIETGDTEFLVQSDADVSSFHTHSAEDARRLWHARQVMEETSDTFQRVIRADSLTRK